MSTANFNSNNTSKIYAYEGEDVYILEDVVYHLENTDWNFSENSDIALENELRSYPAQSIGWFWEYFSYLGINLTLNFIPKSVSGYYSGANLDYDILIEDEYGNTWDSVEPEEILEEYLYNCPNAAGIVAIHKTNFHKKLENKIQEGIDLLEGAFEKVTTPLYKVAQFSNGETIYSAA